MKAYFVDAFTDQLFKGNPAAVCIVDQFPSSEMMQNIALENNLSETAFAVRTSGSCDLRWFTPGGEIDLCGHATLATAFVLAHYYEPKADKFRFNTKSGPLTVTKQDDMYELDLPSYDLKQVDVTEDMEAALGIRPTEAYLGRDLVCVLENETQVRELAPNLVRVEKLDGLIVNVTAPGVDYDSVSRSFAPKLGIDEDPVCGSGHCHIVPYWAKRLHKSNILAFQASKRSGVLYCHYDGKRTRLSGHAVLYAVADLNV